MRLLKLALSLSLALPAFGTCTLARTVTVNNAKVASTLTGFAVGVIGTFDGTSGTPDLRSIAHGGKTPNADTNGYSIGFFSDSGCASILPYETVTFDAVNGVDEFWVLPASISTSNTPFYIRYGDATITTDHSNKTGVWDGNYKGVYHLREASGTYKDSTSNANDSTGGTAPTQAAAQIGFGQTFAAASSQDIVLTNNLATYTAGLTISGWCKAVASQYCFIWDTRGNVPLAGFSIYVDGPSGKGSFYINAPGFVTIASSANLVDSSFHYLVATYNGTSKVGTFYVDGVSQGTSTATSDPTFTAGNSEIQAITQVSLFGSGTVDEIHLSNGIVRSSDWQLAEFNNQSSPSTFISFGSEVSAGGGGPADVVIVPGIL